MTKITDEAAGDVASATTPAPVANRERVGMDDDDEDESAVTRERSNSNNPDGRQGHCIRATRHHARKSREIEETREITVEAK